MLPNSSNRQIPIPGIDPVREAVEHIGASGIEEGGAIFTRPEVVDFILDLAGYTENEPLDQRRVLEPSFGEGEFLIPIVRRLLRSYARRPISGQRVVGDLGDCIRTVELTQAAFRETRERLRATLVDSGLSLPDVHSLLDRWLIRGDFPLEDLLFSFDYVVGNPPYVRQELIPISSSVSTAGISELSTTAPTCIYHLLRSHCCFYRQRGRSGSSAPTAG